MNTSCDNVDYLTVLNLLLAQLRALSAYDINILMNKTFAIQKSISWLTLYKKHSMPIF